MKIRTVLLLTPHFLLLTFLVAGCACRPQPATTTKGPRPNLVFVSFDALQAAHVGSLGYHRDTTPTIDSVARKGYSFTNARSVSSWTVPASMTWFTGVYPSEHRMVNKFALYRPPVRKVADLRELSPRLVTLASVLRDNGYATAGFTGNAGVSGGFGYEHGFDTYYAPTATFGQFDESIPRALAWLREPKDRPFFVFLHGYDVHGQASPAGGFDYRYVEPGYDRRFTGSEQEQELLREEGLDRGHVALRPEDVRFWRAVYDEKVRRADDRFKEFLAEFDRLGLTDNTLFVLTADHGTELYEHRRFDHGFTLYDELLRVPLIFRLPGQTKGAAIPDRIGSIDVMPTILDLLGIAVPDQAQGTSLVPAMNGGRAGRDVFAETDYREFTFKRAIVAPNGWKLIYTLETKARELYDLTADPGEQRDLAAVERGRADDLERRLFKHFADLGHDLGKRRWEIGLNPVYASQGQDRPKK